MPGSSGPPMSTTSKTSSSSRRSPDFSTGLDDSIISSSLPDLRAPGADALTTDLSPRANLSSTQDLDSFDAASDNVSSNPSQGSFPNSNSDARQPFLSPQTQPKTKSTKFAKPSKSPARILTSLPTISTSQDLPFSPTHASPVVESHQDQVVTFGRSLRDAGGIQAGGLDSLGASMPSQASSSWSLKKKSSSRSIGQVFDQATGAKQAGLPRKGETTAAITDAPRSFPDFTSGPPPSLAAKPKNRQGSQPILGIQTSSLPSRSSMPSSRLDSNQPGGISAAHLSSAVTPSTTSCLPSAYPASSLYTPITSGFNDSLSGHRDSDLDGYDFGPQSAISSTSYNTSLASHDRSGYRDKADLDWTERMAVLDEAHSEVKEQEARLQPSLVRTSSNRSRVEIPGSSSTAIGSESAPKSNISGKHLRDHAISVSPEMLFSRLERAALIRGQEAPQSVYSPAPSQSQSNGCVPQSIFRVA